MSKRNAHAVAARARKAGPHDGRRRPDVFDAINGIPMYDTPYGPAAHDMGQTVRVVVPGPYLDNTGKIVRRTWNIDNRNVWGVDFGFTSPTTPVDFLDSEIEGV